MNSRLVRGRTAVAAAILVALLVAAGAGWSIWRQKRDRDVLFSRLPGEAPLLLYLDVDRLRHASALTPLVESQVDVEPDYAAFVKQTGFDYQKDLDAASVAYLGDRVYLLARGRFDEQKLRQYALAQGGSCTGTHLDQPCRMPASLPGRTISFLMLSSNVLALATAPEPDAVRRLETAPAPNAKPLAEAVATGRDAAALLWATATPAGLDGLLVSPNLSLFARALGAAEREYLFLTDRSGNLDVTLEAVCRSEGQAAETQRLLQGLNALAGGMLRGPKSPNEANLWGKVLASAAITRQQNTVRATWSLDQAILKNLGER